MIPGLAVATTGAAAHSGPVTASVTANTAIDGTAIGTLSIGATAVNRRVVLTVFQNSVYGGTDDVAITCGGVTMSKQTVFSGDIGGGATGRATVYWLASSAGTTAEFVASSSIGAHVIVWRVLGASGSVSDYSSAVASSSSVDLPAVDIPLNGALLVHAIMGEQGNGLTFSGTGISELLDASFTIGSNSDRGGAAKREVTTAATGATASVSNSGASAGIIFGATFGA